MRTNGSHFSGRASSGKIASTGHSGSHAPQSMHSSGSMMRMRPASWMQSTGQTSTQERCLMSIQGSAMMYVTAEGLLYRCKEPVDQLPGALEQRRFRDYLVESGCVSAAQTGGVGVVCEAEDRHVRERVRDVVRVDACDVSDHEIRRFDAVRGLETVLGQDGLELPPDEEVDPTQQDRRHV